MIPFYFEGKIPVSKSLFIRQAVCQSYLEADFREATGLCGDIERVVAGIRAIKDNKSIDCGEGAAVLRFLALRASRISGEFVLTGSERLFRRPHEELKNILAQLGVDCQFREGALQIRGEGWRVPQSLVRVGRSVSSQFLSSLVANSWRLPFSLKISWQGPTVSDGYFNMTLAVVQSMGMQISLGPNVLEIPPQQIPNDTSIFEPDMSSAFAVAAMAGAGGRCRILDFPKESVQPDFAFINILRAMGMTVNQTTLALELFGTGKLQPVEVELKDTPDLFPVLAILCAFAKGKSRLFGAPQLIHKESDRLAKIFELLRSLGRDVEPLLDGAIIHGRPFDERQDNRFPISYDPESDHRLVMAACVARQFGFNIRILNSKVVDKSFPQFKEIARI